MIPSIGSSGLKENSIDRAFKLNEGRELTGTLSWATHAGVGSTKNREQAIEDRGKYAIAWRDYAGVQGSGGTKFRTLVLQM
jgi:hypothetical protein